MNIYKSLSSKTLEHYPYIKKKKLTGTARYASIHALEEMEQSRRDDLEGIGYVLMYFLRGNLPWMGMKIKSKEDRIKKILDKKKETSVDELCQNFPEEFREFIDYSRNLEYTEEPKYDKFKNKFYNLVKNKLKENFDYIYDWTTKNDLKKRKLINKNNNINNENESKIEEDKMDDDVEVKIKSNKKEEETNNLNDYSYHKNINGKHILNTNNISNKEDKIKIDDNNNDKVFDDKVDSKCCIM